MFSNSVVNDFNEMNFVVFESPAEQRAFADRLSREGAPSYDVQQFTIALYAALPFYSDGLAAWRYRNGRWDWLTDELKKCNVKQVNIERD